jgi:hypothetical protein
VTRVQSDVLAKVALSAHNPCSCTVLCCPFSFCQLEELPVNSLRYTCEDWFAVMHIWMSLTLSFLNVWGMYATIQGAPAKMVYHQSSQAMHCHHKFCMHTFKNAPLRAPPLRGHFVICNLFKKQLLATASSSCHLNPKCIRQQISLISGFQVYRLAPRGVAETEPT